MEAQSINLYAAGAKNRLRNLCSHITAVLVILSTSHASFALGRSGLADALLSRGFEVATAAELEKMSRLCNILLETAERRLDGLAVADNNCHVHTQRAGAGGGRGGDIRHDDAACDGGAKKARGGCKGGAARGLSGHRRARDAEGRGRDKSVHVGVRCVGHSSWIRASDERIVSARGQTSTLCIIAERAQRRSAQEIARVHVFHR
jgi:hypothetical protein